MAYQKKERKRRKRVRIGRQALRAGAAESAAVIIFLAGALVLVVSFWRVSLEGTEIQHVSGMFSPPLQKGLEKAPLGSAALRQTTKRASGSMNMTSLEFVHITKTGGTAIERAAAREGIRWGVCHFETMPEVCRLLRPDRAWPNTFPLLPSSNFSGTSVIHIPHPNFTFAENWHTPPHWFLHNPFAGKNTFTVVRNPYDRYISEFHCPYFGYYKDMNMRTIPSNRNKLSSNTGNEHRVAHFQQLKREQEAFQAARRAMRMNQNKSNRRKLTSMKQVVPAEINGDPAAVLNKWLLEKLRTYQGATGHLLPQHYYVYDSNGHQVVTHVLKFETLHQDFAKLMERYNLNVTLAPERINAGYRNRRDTRRLTRQDLSPEAVQAINDFCREDFRFGYQMMDPTRMT